MKELIKEKLRMLDVGGTFRVESAYSRALKAMREVERELDREHELRTEQGEGSKVISVIKRIE